MQTLTVRQARRALIRHQNLDGSLRLHGLEGARAMMDRLGSIQYDPLNVVGRNADLVLQARVRGYRPEHLRTLLYREHWLVDGYDKEMCVYTARDFGRFAPQRALHAQATRQWLEGRGQGEAFGMLPLIESIVREKGPCALTDIPIGESRDFGWGPRKPSGAAMEYLFRSGRLCVADKTGTQRRFDLTERLLPPEWLSAPALSGKDFADWYTLRRVRCLGLVWSRRGGAWQGYILSRDADRKAALSRLAERRLLVPCRVEGRRETFYALPEVLEALESRPAHGSARFIAPLDNLLWDRDMIEVLFGFRYRWEVYTPVSKREYGYYVLPVLYGDSFVARFDPYPTAKVGSFKLRAWWWEPDARPSRAMLEAVEAAMRRFSDFLGVPCDPGNMDIIRRSVP